MTGTLDTFGRVLIPKPLRDQLGIEPGAELSLDVHTGGRGPTLGPRPEPAKGALEEQDGLLVYTGTIEPAAYDIVALIKDQRAARARRHAGLDPDPR